MFGDELINFNLWLNGPEFLSLHGLPLFRGNEITSYVGREDKSKHALFHHIIDSKTID
jgi:hypothetical protein